MTGQCSHTCLAKTCLWNKITDAPNPDIALAREIKKLINEVLKERLNTTKTTAKKCATIAQKKGVMNASNRRPITRNKSRSGKK